MHKILIDKNDTALEIVDRVLHATANEITLVIPRHAAVSGNAENFAIIRGEAATAGKEVTVESVDDDVLRAARASGLEAVHPLFARGAAGGKTLSDIVPSNMGAMKVAPAPKATPAKRGRKGTKAEPDEEKVVRKFSLAEELEAEGKPVSYESERTPTEREYFVDAEAEPSQHSHRGRKIVIALIVLVVLALGGAWGAGMVFGKATVALEFKKVPWEYVGEVTIRTADTAPNAETKSLPGEIFNDHRNMTNLFPASGRSNISEKARGKITVYNAYNNQAQALVATTRFMTPDGKIFRLVNGITVPGGKTVSGKMEPGSVEADIIADQVGFDYNVSNIAKLTIPGFQGTPKYDAFYGTITSAVSGGSTGEKAVATADDLAVAKDRTRELLQTSLSSGALRSQPDDFVVVDGASELTVTKLVAVSSTTEVGKFAVFGEGDIKALAFRGGDMKAIMNTLAQASSSGMVLKDMTINYSNAKPDFEKGVLVVTVEAKGTLTGEFDERTVKQAIGGTKVEAAKQTLLKLPHLSHARISLWPFWISTIPAKTDRIHIENQ